MASENESSQKDMFFFQTSNFQAFSLTTLLTFSPVFVGMSMGPIGPTRLEISLPRKSMELPFIDGCSSF